AAIGIDDERAVPDGRDALSGEIGGRLARRLGSADRAALQVKARRADEHAFREGRPGQRGGSDSEGKDGGNEVAHAHVASRTNDTCGRSILHAFAIAPDRERFLRVNAARSWRAR